MVADNLLMVSGVLSSTHWAGLACKSFNLPSVSWICFGGNQRWLRPIRFLEWVSFLMITILFAGLVGAIAFLLTETLGLLLLAFLLSFVALGFFFFSLLLERDSRDSILLGCYIWQPMARGRLVFSLRLRAQASLSNPSFGFADRLSI